MSNSKSSSLNITAELLGLSDIDVVCVHTNLSKRSIVIEVKSTKDQVLCRMCVDPTKGHGLGRKLSFKHLPMFGKKTTIEITPRRGICEKCDNHPTTTELLDWYEKNAKNTEPYEHHLFYPRKNA